MVEQGIPDHLAGVVRQLDEPGDGRTRDRLALVVEADDRARSFAAALLDQTELAVVECASAEAALAVLRHDGDRVAFVFADEALAGPRTGIELARTIAKLWPGVKVVITVEEGADRTGIPSGAAAMTKPWCALELLIAGSQAARLQDGSRPVGA